MAKIFIVAPDAPMEQAVQLKPARTLGSGGIRLGVLDNSKNNADYLLDLIVEGVKKEFQVDSVVIMRKPADPAAEPWLLAGVEEMREMGQVDEARILYDNFYYGRTIHACTANDAKAARIAFAKVSAADLKKGATDYCKTKQIEL